METLSKENELTQTKFSLFSVVGIEIEYMIVDGLNLNILPIADQILQNKNELNFGKISWNNELAAHVIELKLTTPADSFNNLDLLFYDHVKKIQTDLKKSNASLLPGGMHPWMDPTKETKIWAHENNDIYEQFHNIFDCYRHGWANLQSIHLNFPFSSENDFRKLHSSLRILLPIIPAIAASTPFADGKKSGLLDTRLEIYTSNSSKFPIITGDVIPDVITSYEELEETIYNLIAESLAPYTSKVNLNPVWVNARGIIPRFDRSSIEMRVIDSQESPLADMAISEAIFLTAKAIYHEKWQSLKFLETIRTKDLVSILKQCMKSGDDALIDHTAFLSCFGLKKPVLAKELWEKIYSDALSGSSHYDETFAQIVEKGPLAKRLLQDYKKTKTIKPLYEKLALCLEKNQLYGIDNHLRART